MRDENDIGPTDDEIEDGMIERDIEHQEAVARGEEPGAPIDLDSLRITPADNWRTKELSDQDAKKVRSLCYSDEGSVGELARKHGPEALKLLTELKSAKMVEMQIENDGDEAMLGLSSGLVVLFVGVDYIGNGWVNLMNAWVDSTMDGDPLHLSQNNSRRLEGGMDVAVKDIVWVTRDPFGRERIRRKQLARDKEAADKKARAGT